VHTQLCAPDAAHTQPLCFVTGFCCSLAQFRSPKASILHNAWQIAGCKLAFLPTTSRNQRPLCSIAMHWDCHTFSGIRHRSHTPAPCKFAMLAAHGLSSSLNAAQGSAASSALPDASGACSISVLQQVSVAIHKRMTAISVFISI